MIAILCNSPYLSTEIASCAHPLFSVLFPTNSSEFLLEDHAKWLSSCLIKNEISMVFYESRFFVDPSYFRSLSPNTNFVLISSYGEDSLIQEALVCGATAFIQKPIQMPEVDRIFSLVEK